MAVKFLAGNKITGLSTDSKPDSFSTDIVGVTFFETNTQDLYLWDGDSWELVVGNSATENLSNKTFTDYCLVSEVSTPSGTVGSGKGALYAKSNGKAYWKFENGTEVDLTLGSAGGEANENSFKTIARSGTGSGSSIVAQNAADTITLVGGTNMTLTYGGTASDPTITFASATGVTALDGLSDVTIAGESGSNATDAHLLIYDSDDSRFENKAISGDIKISRTGVASIQANSVALATDTTGDYVQNITASGGLSSTGATSGENIVHNISIATDGVTTTKIADGDVTNAKLDNSTITVAAESGSNDAVALGETLTFAAGEGIDTAVSANTITITGELASTNNIGVASFSGDNFTVSSGAVTIKDGGVILGTETTGNYVATLTGTSDEITVSGSTGAVTISLPDDVVIGNDLTVTGDLTVSGDTVTVNTATLTVEDILIELSKGQNTGTNTDAVDVGLYAPYRVSGGTRYRGLFYDLSTTRWKFFNRSGGSDAVPGTSNIVNTTSGFALGDLEIGALTAASLDISGNVEVDGTLEADAYTVDGTTLAEYIADTAGAMFTGNTETGLAATYEDGDNTIDLVITPAQTTITSVLNTSLVIGRDADNDIDFATDNTILLRASGADQIKLIDGVLAPVTTNDVDLGTSDLQFKNAYFDGTVDADAYNVGSDSLATYIAGITVTNATNAGTATNITTADTNATTTYVGLWESAATAQAPKTDAALTYNAATATLTDTRLGAFTAVGAIDFGNQNMTQVDIDSGAIDNTTIGATTPSTIVATTVGLKGTSNAVTIDVNNDVAAYTVILPDAAPAAGKFLKTTSNSTSQLEWGDAAGSSGASESFAIAMAVAL